MGQNEGLSAKPLIKESKSLHIGYLLLVFLDGNILHHKWTVKKQIIFILISENPRIQFFFLFLLYSSNCVDDFCLDTIF